ncbi:lycopene cyclase domain-containing protein [Salinadaptatus halalkaliphilus]|uniref:Lycopene cyclase domain-containing protein n=1 Tax=Salinadaptatus halalkaliphilus TaxID=2419781 RepID=A0A4S3TJK9_9EURY|nr:lycopene cyclase domain-containing protein [Salinadaptatus halalkaliphilus]THE64176.1 lycopene cyclase domain-containing protein [Salinadaptatus halalkaliphilus]
MSPPLSYLEFHLVFLLPPILVLAAAAWWRSDAWIDRRSLSGLCVLVGLAVVYTTPWTNHLIPAGVWWYGDGAVLATIWHTPVEEYLFFVLQPVLTGLWLFQFLDVVDRPLEVSLRHRATGVAGGLVVCLAGWFLLGSTTTYYLGWLLFWAGPILAIQWGFGLPYLREVWPMVGLAVAVPTLYLWVVDRIAIELGIWMISSTQTTGIALLGLPIEEALFFLLTNVFIVQGLVLYVWVLERLEGDSSLDRLPVIGSNPTNGP